MSQNQNNSNPSTEDKLQKGLSQNSKARYWVGVLYVENMIDDWEDKISEIVQVPFAYCIHNADVDSMSEHRKDHIHLILVFSNTTTYKHALSVFDLLSATGKRCCNTCERIISIRNKYEYLIHNTETCKKKGKHLYKPSERITGNGFDIGLYEQLSLSDKDRMCRELADYIVKNGFCNFIDFYASVMNDFDESYFEIIKSYSGFFERLTKGNFQKNAGR